MAVSCMTYTLEVPTSVERRHYTITKPPYTTVQYSEAQLLSLIAHSFDSKPVLICANCILWFVYPCFYRSCNLAHNCLISLISLKNEGFYIRRTCRRDNDNCNYMAKNRLTMASSPLFTSVSCLEYDPLWMNVGYVCMHTRTCMCTRLHVYTNWPTCIDPSPYATSSYRCV